MQLTKRTGVMLLGFCLILVLPHSVVAADPTAPVTTTTNKAKATISIGTEILDGDTTYQIGYPITMDGMTYEGYFPFSELKWPLDIVLARIDGSATFRDTIRINASFKKNITDPDDNMEDSDWITDSNPNQLDIYSESSISDFSAMIFDLDVEYIFLKKKMFSLYGGIGYQFQKFSYDGTLLYQNSPSGLSGYDHIGDGRVGITYKIKYHIPYLLLGTDLQLLDNLSVGASFAFSPYVQSDDEDHHLLREYGGKISTSDMDGTAIMFDVSGKYNFTPRWFVELGFHYIDIEVDGTMDQSYAWFGYFGSNKVESESSQTSGYISLGASF